MEIPLVEIEIALPKRPLRGTIVALRTWEPDDSEWYVAARDEVIFQWTTEPRGLTADAVRHTIEAQLRRPRFAGFAITDLKTKELLGNISLVFSEPDCHQAEIMYWLSPAARGRGAATDAVRIAIGWAFDASPIDQIELLTSPGNEASQRVARRAGFTPSGNRGNQLVFRATRQSWKQGSPLTH